MIFIGEMTCSQIIVETEGESQRAHSESSKLGEIISNGRGKVAVWKEFMRKGVFDLGLIEQGVLR